MMKGKMNQLTTKCSDWIKNSVPTVSTAAVSNMCGQNDEMTEQTLADIDDYCYWQTQPKWQEIASKWGITFPQANLMCGPGGQVKHIQNLERLKTADPETI